MNENRLENLIPNGTLGAEIRFDDRNGNRRHWTTKVLSVGVVQGLEGLLNTFPDADRIEIAVKEDCHPVAELQIKNRFGNLIPNGRLGGQIRFEDRNGNRRRWTTKTLPVGVVQALEGMLNTFPDATSFQIVVRGKDYHTFAELEIQLKNT